MIHNKLQGFTLIELLIAIAIFSVILIGIYPVFVQVTTFNQENYIRTALMDNLRAGMDRLVRELREATSVELEDSSQSQTPIIQESFIIFSHPDPNSETGDEDVKYELSSSSYPIKYFPEGKEIKRYVFNSDTNSWEGGNPVTEATIYSLKFLRIGQIIKIEIISKVELRQKSAPQDYIYITNVTVRNPLT